MDKSLQVTEATDLMAGVLKGTEVGLQTQVKNCIVSNPIGDYDCYPHSLVFVLASATRC